MINKFTTSFGCLIVLLLMSCAGLKANTAAHEFTHREKVIFAALCVSENKLAVISREGIITIWDMNSGTKIREINTERNDAVNSMLYTSFGQIIVQYKTDEKSMMVYDAEDFVIPFSLGPYNVIEYFTCSPDGRSLIFLPLLFLIVQVLMKQVPETAGTQKLVSKPQLSELLTQGSLESEVCQLTGRILNILCQEVLKLPFKVQQNIIIDIRLTLLMSLALIMD